MAHAARAGVVAASALLALAGCLESGPAPEPGVADPASHRWLPAGDVVGFVDAAGGHTWRGIPYAQPPIGPLRWRAPRRVGLWRGTREALSLGSACLQPGTPILRSQEVGLQEPAGSEDCLYLNIHAPRWGPDDVPISGARLPVMVWIHGGANAYGEGGSYDLAAFAVEQNVVAVTVNYRLGVFGWFHHPGLWDAGDGPRDRSGNFALLDLVAALDWLQENIGGFGGDPDNVTVFGASAGGHNALALLFVEGARHRMHRVISQSGSLASVSPAEAANWSDAPEPGMPYSAKELHARLRIAAGLDDERETARASIEAMRLHQASHELRGLPAELFLEVLGSDWAETPAVIRDGEVLPAEPLPRALAAGRFQAMPVLLGTTRDEPKFFMAMSPSGLFDYLVDEEDFHRDAEYGALHWKAVGVDEAALAMAASGHRQVWAYRFDWDEEPDRYGLEMSRLLGAFHGVEGPFVLGESAPMASFVRDESNASAVDALARQVRSYWTQFALHGDPGRGRAGDLLAWTPFDVSSEGAPRMLLLDGPSAGGPRMSPEGVTVRSLFERLMADERFDAEERCDLARDLARRTARTGLPVPPVLLDCSTP